MKEGVSRREGALEGVLEEGAGRGGLVAAPGAGWWLRGGLGAAAADWWLRPWRIGGCARSGLVAAPVADWLAEENNSLEM